MATWQASTFNGRLEELGMSLACTSEDWSGLALVANLAEERDPSVRIALELARDYGADAVFFRQFTGNSDRSPLPQIYIYNRMQELDWNPDEFGQIQRRLWNAGTVPLAVVLTVGEVKLFSCRKEPEPTAGRQFRCQWFERLETTLAAERLILKHGVASGTLWEDPKFAADFSFEGSAHHKLLEHLRHFKAKLLASNELPPKVATRLLVLVILLKYLEDRKDTQGRGVFPPHFVATLTGGQADKLPGLFAIPGTCIALFDSLSHHFNGGIFALSATERQHLQSADLSPVVEFMQGTQEPSGQQVFWPLYSFNDLPVELVSNIYEEFLATDGKERGGIVYTPPIMAELLLGATLPLDPSSLNWRILDPACGSGIFLVGAFRRLVHCWRMANDWRLPGHNDLKAILRNNVFGCDLEPEAVLVTAFSLCVALCDELDPKVIWEELRFDDLREKNLRATDFFEFAGDSDEQNSYDLVIGNPPFISRLTTPAARRVEERAADCRPGIPDNQLALLFLDQAFKVCRNNGRVCLIQPAGPLLYNLKARAFRNWLFDRTDVQCVLDFTPLESVLFSANVAAAAVIARNRPPEGDELLHVVFRRTHATKGRLVLETDYYDFHRLGREFIKKNPYAWKTDLLGGGRMHRMVQRFVEMPTLGEFLRARRKDGWREGEGFIEGAAKPVNAADDDHSRSAEELQHAFKLRRKLKLAPHITGCETVPTNALTASGFDRGKVVSLPLLFFEEPRNSSKAIFQPPHLLIRETIEDGVIPTYLSRDYLTFRDSIIGIHAPQEDLAKLELIEHWINEGRFGAFWAAVAGTKSLVKRATSYQKSDLMALPFPEDREEMKLNEWEKELVADVLEVMVEFRRRGENADAVKRVSEQALQVFASTYCRSLNAVYKEFRSLRPIFMGRSKDAWKEKPFVCCPFCYGEKPEIDLPTDDQAESVLQELCHRQHGPRLFVNRIIRLYEQNVILMIKPNQKRFWLRSVAMRDADETVAELLKAGY